jgi:predicted HTH transcriptional regulator
VEFKLKLPDNTRSSRRTVFKTISAFANGLGGSVLFGITDGGEVVGLADEDANPIDRFHNMLRSSTSPTPPCHDYEQWLGDKHVLVVEVEANTGTIFSVTIEADHPEFYVRRGATTFYARGEELEKVIGAIPQETSALWSLN